MTGQTPVVRYHFRGRFSVTVTFQAGKALHAEAVNHFVLVAAGACLFIGGKGMRSTRVTLAAGDIFHKDVPCMAVGFLQGHRPLGYIRQMAFLAGVPGRNAAVFLPGRFGPPNDISDEHPVLLENAHYVASLAGEVPVGALPPGLICFLHEVA